ncbi:MAG: SOS response-associated peptidase [Alphaproteobacteria bacterium]|nr:SOS response-associated peptidase [Alphaproteobacteria bacterium]
MCGRYKQLNALQGFLELYGLQTAPDADFTGFDGTAAMPGRAWNVLRAAGGGCVEAAPLFWGFTPHWAQEDFGTKIINARAETLAEKPSFRDALKSRRCIVPAAAFMEWDRAQKPSQPYDIHAASGAPLAFAGLWDAWRNAQDGTVKEGFAIITTAASDDVARIHDRMPLLLSTPESCARWLGADTAQDTLRAMLSGDESRAFPLALTPAARPKRAEAPEKAENRAQLALF